MQIKRILAALTLLLATASLSANATVKVNNLFLVKNSQFTELTIACDGKCEFTHQIVEEAANKPYRIVVDIKDAVHGLPQHVFTSLPTGMVKQIRTSQFSSDPEKVVRVVIDAVGSLTYKVKAGDNGVTLFINTPSDPNFAMWSAVPGATPPATLVNNDAPPSMPAFPGNEQSAPKVDKSDPAKSDLKLASKPIDEGKLLNKSKSADSSQPAPTVVITTPNQPQPKPQQPQQAPVTQAAVDPSPKETPVQTSANPPAEKQVVQKPAQQPAVAAQPPVKVDPKLLESIYGEEQPAPLVAAANPAPAQPKAAEQQPVKEAPKTQVTATPEVKTEPAKVADSAVIPQMKAPATSPALQPSESVKPPKAQKTGLPDLKVNPKPKFAGEENGNPLDPKLAMAMKNDNPQTPAAAVSGENNVVAHDDAASKLKSKSDAVRERYQSERAANQAERVEAIDSAALAQQGQDEVTLSKIDKIRLKYKRGIKFVQDEDDEQRMALEDSEYIEEDVTVPTPQVGPYNEFLPEREIVVYASSGRIDPFEPLVEDAQKTAGYDRIPDVESLRLVGILQDKKSSRALFEDANGYSYILQTGDRVKNGFVLSISDDRVVFQIRQYGWNRQVALDLEETH